MKSTQNSPKKMFLAHPTSDEPGKAGLTLFENAR
jgi:hypothetical protein